VAEVSPDVQLEPPPEFLLSATLPLMTGPLTEVFDTTFAEHPWLSVEYEDLGEGGCIVKIFPLEGGAVFMNAVAQGIFRFAQLFGGSAESLPDNRGWQVKLNHPCTTIAFGVYEKAREAETQSEDAPKPKNLVPELADFPAYASSSASNKAWGIIGGIALLVVVILVGALLAPNLV